MKNKIIILLSCVFSGFFAKLYAYQRQEMFDTANRILQLGRNQGDYSSYVDMMEMYQDFREKIKSDLKLGNPNTAVDYELLVEGLVLENYTDLQSVLGFNNYHDTTTAFADIIEKERTYTQKIAYALKQNKIAFQTSFEVKKTEQQLKCTLMLNGKKLNRTTFIGPAGVPFYIGLYCPEHKFEIKKVQGSETQKNYSISFDNLKTAIYRDDPVEMGLPNPHRLQIQRAKLIEENKEPSLLGSPEWKVETGVGLDVYLRYSPKNYYIYSGANSPILLYSSTQLLYKNLELQIDIGPVSNENRNNSFATSVVEKEHTLFLRPLIAYNTLIYRHKQLFALNGDIGVVTFFAGTKDVYLKPMTIGPYAGLEPKFYLGSPFFLGLKFATSLNIIGSAQNSLVGFMLRFGADF